MAEINDSNAKLEKINEAYREQMLSRNIYSQDDPYDTANSRALSDGDQWGRGEYNNSIGTSVDITARNEMLKRNKYSADKPYA